MEFMDTIIELWLAFSSIAFLIETCILIGKYFNVATISGMKIKLYFLFLMLIIAIVSGMVGGVILKLFEHNVFNLTIILVVWIPLYYPIYYSFYKLKEPKIADVEYFKCKDYQEITPEDTIVINFLIDTHKRVFSDIDALDTKIAQIIALNGVIISLVFLGTSIPQSNNLIILGLAIIICSIVIGVASFSPRTYFVGPPPTFYKKYREGGGIGLLINKIVDRYPQNVLTHNKKADLFRYMLVSLLLGLIVLIASLSMQSL